MSGVDRAALIQAGVEAWHQTPDVSPVTLEVGAVLDAVLPLIADAIELEADQRRARIATLAGHELTHDPVSSCYLRVAARLVLSFLDGSTP